MIEKIELVGGETLYIDKGGYPHPYYVKELSAGEFELLSQIKSKMTIYLEWKDGI
jgi:hypothetical protein